MWQKLVGVSHKLLPHLFSFAAVRRSTLSSIDCRLLIIRSVKETTIDQAVCMFDEETTQCLILSYSPYRSYLRVTFLTANV